MVHQEKSWEGGSSATTCAEVYVHRSRAGWRVKQHGGRLAQRVPVACRDYQPYPVDLPLSSQKRRNLDLQEESGLEDEKSSRTTEEEVERPQQPFKRSRWRLRHRHWTLGLPVLSWGTAQQCLILCIIICFMCVYFNTIMCGWHSTAAIVSILF